MFEGIHDRIARHRKAGTTDRMDGVVRPKASLYTDPLRFEIEAESVFRERPVSVGLAADVAKPGDFVTRDLLGTSVLVMMGGDGKRRAFVNACRHRGSKLVDAASGAGLGGITCPYHAWSYANTGALASCPGGEENFPDVDRGELGLAELPLAVLHSQLFVTTRPKPQAAPPFTGIAPDLDAYGVSGWVPFERRRETIQANWKIAVENFLEGYHIGTVHAGTVGRKVLEGLTLYDRFGDDQRIVFPLKSVEGPGIGPATPGRELARHLSVNYFFFPSTVMLIVAGEYALHETFTPVSVGETRVDRTVLVPALAKGKPAEGELKKAAAFFDRFVAEDVAAIERAHEGARSLEDRLLTIGRAEPGVADLLDSVDRCLAARRLERRPGQGRSAA